MLFNGCILIKPTISARIAVVLAALVAATACKAPVQSEDPLTTVTDADAGFAGALDVAASADGDASKAVADGAGAQLDGLSDTSAGPTDATVADVSNSDAASAVDDSTDSQALEAASATDAELGVDSGQPGDSGATTACEDSAKVCPQAFAYAGAGSETAVEVRGSWNGWKAGGALTATGTTWSGTVKLPQAQSFQYKFRIVLADGKELWKLDSANPLSADDGFGGKNSVVGPLQCPSDGICPQPQTLCGAPLKAKAFDWRDGVLYFVFVDRFVNGNPANDGKNPDKNVPAIANWHGGDWLGVKQKIDDGYFGALGVNVLWLTVPLDNTDAVEMGDEGKPYTAYHGYWPRDIDKPNAHFGSMADLKALVDAAHAKGIMVILDYAMNHLHASSPTFSNHPEWFHPLKVNGQFCTCGSGVCPWDGPSGVFCWFREYLPDFDFDNAVARKASIDNVIWWMDQSGADGLRLDAIKHVEDIWLTELRARLNTEVEPKRGQHIWLVGETYTGDQGFIKSFVEPCTKLDGQFDFPLRAVLDNVVLLRQGKMQDLHKFVTANDSFYGPTALMSTFAGNHDLPRIIHYAQDKPLYSNVWDVGKDNAFFNTPTLVAENSAYQRVAVAMTVLYGSPGVPLVYYGDEIGLPGAGDPDNRRPMQFKDLSDNQKWLLEQHQKLGQARKAHSALRRGTRTTLATTDDGWLWAMTDAKQTVWVAVNRGDNPITLQGLPAGEALKDLLSGETLTGPNCAVPPRTGRIVVKQ